MMSPVVGLAILLSASPEPAQSGRVTAKAFEGLMSRLARAWSTQDTELALSCFTEDASYMQPPDLQLYRGASELRKLFGALKPGTAMMFHNLAFEARTQVGFGEFSFGSTSAARADHGVVVVHLRGGRIASWREYFQEGPARFEEFVAPEGKAWKWTGRNYP